MRITQGTFSYLPDLSDDELREQARYAIRQGWALGIEFSDDPHPRNTYWELWDRPAFDAPDADQLLHEVGRCRAAFPGYYVRVVAYDSSPGRQTTAFSIIVQRPADEPGFRLRRQEGGGRQLGYTLDPYASARPHGQRYPGSTPR